MNKFVFPQWITEIDGAAAVAAIDSVELASQNEFTFHLIAHTQKEWYFVGI